VLDFMPRLKRLFVSVSTRRVFANSWFPLVYNGIMHSADEVARSQRERALRGEPGWEVPLTLALPTGAILSIKTAAEKPEGAVDKGAPYLLWRNLDEDEAVTQLRESTYPWAPPRGETAKQRGEAEGSLGYWIMEGMQGSRAFDRHDAAFYPAHHMPHHSPADIQLGLGPALNI
jgi:hypothetical protein